ncbi:hypothetical protein AGMMS49944_24960 [Spirochaetia bacterium]|nr:hypothetical protein AGMMS49944_24960 [Spirochaetia bacterium]
MDYEKIYEATQDLDAPLQSVEDGLPVKETETPKIKIDTSKFPIIDIEVSEDENNYFNAMQNSKTKEEREAVLKEIEKSYKPFRTNYMNKSVINNASKIKILLAGKGIDHCFQQWKNYELCPAIKYLQTIIENSYHTTETSQHLDEPNTNRGEVAHIFYCNGKYINKFKKENQEKLHTLRIATITFKKNNQINFRHISKYKENKETLCVELVSIDFL